MEFNMNEFAQMLVKPEPKDITIKSQADVIRDIWGQHSKLKKVLADDHPDVFNDVMKKL